jgi:hypothetical protein
MTAADQVKGHGLRLPDGRWLGFHIYGDPGGTPILFLHGTPGSRLKLSIAHEVGRQRPPIEAGPVWCYLSDAPSEGPLRDHAGETRSRRPNRPIRALTQSVRSTSGWRTMMAWPGVHGASTGWTAVQPSR